MKKTKGLIIFAAIVVFIIGFVMILGLFEQENFLEKYEGTDLSYDVRGLGRENTYKLFKMEHASSPLATEGFSVRISILQAPSGRAEHNYLYH